MKRKALISIVFILSVIFIYAQSPQAFKYQAVLRDADGLVRQNEPVEIEVSIRQGSGSGTEVFYETHNTQTNEFGLVNLNVGTINPSGFASIDWSDGPYFVKIFVDGTVMGTSQLLSVPYALFGEDEDADPSNELQVLSQSGYNVTLSQGGGTVSVEDDDADPENEFQTLSISGNNLTIEPNGNTVPLPPPGGGEDLAQTLSIGNTAGSYDIDMDNEEVKNASRLDLYDSQDSYIDLYYGKIKDYWGSYGSSGDVLSCGSSSSNYVEWVPGGGGENLSQTLAIGNTAGSYDIDMDNEEVKNASRLDLNDQDSYIDLYYGKIKDYWGSYGSSGQVLSCGSSSSNYVEWVPGGGGGENLSQTLAIGNSAGSYDIDMDNEEVKNASRLDLNDQDSYIDLYYGKIRDYWGSYGNSGQVLTCGSSSSHYVKWSNVSSNSPSIGNKNCVERGSKGPVLMYCQVSTENWIEDFGEGIINNGECRIDMRNDFAEVVTVNQDHPIHVFITPNSNIENWWVEKDNSGFILFAPNATNNSSFDFRIVAKQVNFENNRMRLHEASYNDVYLYPENMGAYPKDIYKKLEGIDSDSEPYEEYRKRKIAYFEPNESSPYNFYLPNNWKQIREEAKRNFTKFDQESQEQTTKEIKPWFDEFGNVIPTEIVDTLKALNYKMFTFEQAQKRRFQGYIDNAISRQKKKEKAKISGKLKEEKSDLNKDEIK